MKFSSMHPFGFAAIKFRKGLEARIQDTTVASSDNSLKPFSLNMLLLDMPMLVLSEFNWCASSLSPREHLSKLYRPSFFKPIKVWSICINMVVFILLFQASHFCYLFYFTPIHESCIKHFTKFLTFVTLST